MVFLFCILEIFEMVLIINDMNKTEKLEVRIKNDLKVLQDNIILLSKYFEHKKINIKQCNRI